MSRSPTFALTTFTARFTATGRVPTRSPLGPGLLKKYGWKSEDEAKKQVKVYGNYEALLDDPNIEAVVIALPLHLHAEAAIKAMRKGKHVLTEKLMGQTVAAVQGDGPRLRTRRI